MEGVGQGVEPLRMIRNLTRFSYGIDGDPHKMAMQSTGGIS
jgi:hypothetical protein